MRDRVSSSLVARVELQSRGAGPPRPRPGRSTISRSAIAASSPTRACSARRRSARALTSSTTTRLTASAATTTATAGPEHAAAPLAAARGVDVRRHVGGRHRGVALPPVARLVELETGQQPGLGRAGLAPVGGPALEPAAQAQVVAAALDQLGQRRPGREQRLVGGRVDLLLVDLVDHDQPGVDQVVEDRAVRGGTSAARASRLCGVGVGEADQVQDRLGDLGLGPAAVRDLAGPRRDRALHAADRVVRRVGEPAVLGVGRHPGQREREQRQRVTGAGVVDQPLHQPVLERQVRAPGRLADHLGEVGAGQRRDVQHGRRHRHRELGRLGGHLSHMSVRAVITTRSGEGAVQLVVSASRNACALDLGGHRDELLGLVDHDQHLGVG